MATFTLDLPGHGAFGIGGSAGAFTGHALTLNAQARITDIRWFLTDAATGATVQVRDSANNILATVTTSQSYGTGWQQLTLPSPVLLSPSVEYLVGVFTNNLGVTFDSPAGTVHTHTAGSYVATLSDGYVINTRQTGDREYGIGMVLETTNDAPTAPTLVTPVGNPTFDRNSSQRFSWQHNDPNSGDGQSKYDLRYRVTGAGTWTTVSANTPQQFRDFAGGTFAAGSYEWQVRTYDQQGVVGPYSASEFFTAATPPNGPTITAPANGATVSTSNVTLSWSYPTQSAYQVQVLDAADAVVSDTGTVSGTTGQTARSVVLSLATNNVTRKLQVRVQDSGTGLWSPYSQVTVTVSFTPPATPSLSVSPESAAGTVVVTIYNPAPTGSQPVVASVEVEVRALTAGDPYRPLGVAVRLSSNAGSAFTDRAPASGIAYEYRATAVGANSARASSAWSAGTTYPATYQPTYA